MKLLFGLICFTSIAAVTVETIPASQGRSRHFMQCCLGDNNFFDHRLSIEYQK